MLKQGKPEAAQTPQQPPKPQKPPAAQPQTPQPATTGALDVYVVKAGDTLFAIATRHGMSVDELMKLNGLTGTLIHPGDKLRVKQK